ncbi:hypothetical protein BDP27DRAFT_575143 [Rhodocollybia butyracea]|uniref:PNPLA domain-containing protein n=1 Tax=Rhodocollybia butyracea TaxID=206335 RepID=A0A9P5P8J0_9AGAR|nr:hypothetical protein BDP27DRAFT_575143 [Rhodocollybia butyracea]
MGYRYHRSHQSNLVWDRQVQMAKDRKYILSLDGGGYRGLSCLITLNHVMRLLVDDPDEDPIPAPCEVFDLICGTSTGGLISILLGRLGLDCMTAISVYKELGPLCSGKTKGKCGVLF